MPSDRFTIHHTGLGPGLGGGKPEMLEYHRNTCLNVGALDGHDSFSSFLHPRDEETTQICKDTNLYVRKQRDSPSPYASSALNLKAWCLQERLLRLGLSTSETWNSFGNVRLATSARGLLRSIKYLLHPRYFSGRSINQASIK